MSQLLTPEELDLIRKDVAIEYREDISRLVAVDLLGHIEAREQAVRIQLLELREIADQLHQFNGDFGPYYVEVAAEKLNITL